VTYGVAKESYASGRFGVVRLVGVKACLKGWFGLI
jgi:hypothetical protein